MTLISRGDRLLIATHNKGKFEEISALFSQFGLDLVFAGDVGLASPVESETSFVGNARIKAHAAAQETGLPSLSDDSGLEIDCLGGLPGVWSADWAEGSQGRNFDKAMQRVFREIKATKSPEPWTARFKCCLVLAFPDGSDRVFEGKVDGRIVFPGRGEKGHGYDPIFVPDGGKLSFAEMDRWEKNRMSHRGRAFEAMIAACFT